MAEERFTICFDKPVPLNLFVAVLEGVTRRFPDAVWHTDQPINGIGVVVSLGERELIPDD